MNSLFLKILLWFWGTLVIFVIGSAFISALDLPEMDSDRRAPAAQLVEFQLYQARWGPALPRQITATLPDDTRLEVDVDEPELGPRLPAAAFDEPPHEGYRPIDAGAARDLIGGRR